MAPRDVGLRDDSVVLHLGRDGDAEVDGLVVDVAVAEEVAQRVAHACVVFGESVASVEELVVGVSELESQVRSSDVAQQVQLGVRQSDQWQLCVHGY